MLSFWSMRCEIKKFINRNKSNSARVFNRKPQCSATGFKRLPVLSIRPGKPLPPRPLSLENHNMLLFIFGLTCNSNNFFYYSEEALEYIEQGSINGLFVLGRSIGFIGHFMDQKRLKQGLYRHPWDDISYVLPEQYNQ